MQQAVQFCFGPLVVTLRQSDGAVLRVETRLGQPVNGTFRASYINQALTQARLAWAAH